MAELIVIVVATCLESHDQHSCGWSSNRLGGMIITQSQRHWHVVWDNYQHTMARDHRYSSKLFVWNGLLPRTPICPFSYQHHWTLSTSKEVAYMAQPIWMLWSRKMVYLDKYSCHITTSSINYLWSDMSIWCYQKTTSPLPDLSDWWRLSTRAITSHSDTCKFPHNKW